MSDRSIRASATLDRREAALRTLQQSRAGNRQVHRLVALLDLGFAPERAHNDQSTSHTSPISLRYCPFLALVTNHSQLPCQIHLDLMQGAKAASQEPVTVNRLEPFTEPAGYCPADHSRGDVVDAATTISEVVQTQ